MADSLWLMADSEVFGYVLWVIEEKYLRFLATQ